MIKIKIKSLGFSLNQHMPKTKKQNTLSSKVLFGSWVLEEKGWKRKAWEEVNPCLRVLKK
jgi:hypothetical protein